MCENSTPNAKNHEETSKDFLSLSESVRKYCDLIGFFPSDCITTDDQMQYLFLLSVRNPRIYALVCEGAALYSHLNQGNTVM